MEYKNINFEIKHVDLDTGIIEGYGNVFNVKDLVNDITAPGAFAKSIEAHKQSGTAPVMLWQHDPNKVIGVWTDISEDEKGLKLRGQLVKGIQLADEAMLLLKAKALNGLSIGYRVKDSEYDRTQKATILKEVDLHEVSVVTFPANTSSRIERVKAALNTDELPSIRDVEQCLREMGFSSKSAKTIVKYGYDALINEEKTDEFVTINTEANQTASTDAKSNVQSDTSNGHQDQLKELLDLLNPTR